MSHPTNPSEIARETLKRLAASRQAPTPENYQACYNEIANIPDKAHFPEQQLKHLAMALPAKTGAQEKQLLKLGDAITRRSWKAVEKSLLAFIEAIHVGGTKDTAGHPAVAELPAEFSERLAHFIEGVLPALGDKTERGPEMANMLLQALRSTPVVAQLIQEMLANTAHQTKVSIEEQAQIRSSLLKLLHLILENIGELTLDESWLKGQVDGLLSAIEPPLTLRQLDAMELRLCDVIVKQREAKRQSVEAQEEMRKMLASFVTSLGTITRSSAAFQEKIEESARKIKKVRRIEELAPLLKEVIDATNLMAEGTSYAQENLKRMQEKVEATETRLMHLYQELNNASIQARHDPLTDALNRKGLEEALAREIASVRRKNLPLSICLLDVDNFKKLNDRLGHDTGDKALIHLVNVARQCMRPNDSLVRYGGEEFIILMPDTFLEPGIEAMTRLQRELTKKFFLSEKEKILITFSAGVVQLGTEETGMEAINRADQAMYLAKRAGKNRVVGG